MARGRVVYRRPLDPKSRSGNGWVRVRVRVRIRVRVRCCSIRFPGTGQSAWIGYKWKGFESSVGRRPKRTPEEYTRFGVSRGVSRGVIRLA